MKGINYWRVREQAALERYLAEETDYEARLEEIYKTAADNIEKEIQSLLSKYAATENITMADARKRADRMDVEAFSRKAARYVKEKNFSEKANRELKLYNLKMKISRLELLKKHINLELIAAADEAERELRSDLEKRAMDELKRQAGILGGGAENVAEAAKAIAAGTFYGETFSGRLWSNTEAMNKKLSALLSSGLIRGQNPRVLARSIREEYIGPERLKNGRRGAVYAAERLMRTELSRVQTEAQLRSFEESGIEEYEFIATTNCCPICDALDGKHFKVRDLVAGENAPPMHPNCRCSAAPWVGDASNTSERSRNKKGTIFARVDWNRVNTPTYRNKFRKLPFSDAVNQKLYEKALDILKHRDGSLVEDMHLIDSTSGIVVASQTKSDYYAKKEEDKFGQVNYNESLNRAVAASKNYTLIGIHNHPTGGFPSGFDISSAYYRAYKASVIVGHDGSVFVIYPPKKYVDPNDFDSLVKKYYNSIHEINGDVAADMVEAFSSVAKANGVRWMRL